MNKLCFSPDVFEQSLGCAERRIDGSDVATSTWDTSVELEDPLVNPSVHGWSSLGISVSTFRPWSATAGVSFTSPKAVVWCSVACTHETTKGKKLSVVQSMFFQFLMRWGWLPWMPFIRVIVFFTRCTERTAGDSFKNWTWTNMSISQTFTLASSVVWVVPFAVTEESFDFCIVFYSSNEVNLLCPQWTLSLSLPTYFSQVNKHCLWELVWRTYFDSQNINLELCTRFFCEIQIALLSSKVRTFGLRWLWDLVWMTPNASPKILSLQNILVRENRWGFFFFSFISRFRCVFEYTCVSEIASTWRFEYCTSKNMPMITWTSSIETSLLEDCTKVVCSLFLTGVVQ